MVEGTPNLGDKKAAEEPQSPSAAFIALPRKGLLEVNLVLFNVARPLGRDVGVGEDRLDRTLGLARTSVDALVRVDVVLVIGFVNTVDRTYLDTTRVFGLDARLCNDIGHNSECPFMSVGKHSAEFLIKARYRGKTTRLVY